MKSDNSASAGAAQSARMPVRQAHLARTDKVLVLSLEATGSGAIVLHCHGSAISRSDARGLTSLIAEVLPTARRLVVDLAGVISLDSGALGELVVTQMWAEAAGYALKFSSPTDSVRRLFEVTNLESVFDLHSSAEEALDAMQLDHVRPA
jgi:anti-sigma B factor antagonist